MKRNDFSRQLEKEVLPNGYIRPEIKGEGFNFEWSKHSYGIPEDEKNQFKIFVQDVIPIIEELVIISRQIEKLTEKIKNLNQFQSHEAFEPLIELSQKTVYYASITVDGMVYIDRKEIISNSPIDARWELGRLVLM